MGDVQTPRIQLLWRCFVLASLHGKAAITLLWHFKPRRELSHISEPRISILMKQYTETRPSYFNNSYRLRGGRNVQTATGRSEKHACFCWRWEEHITLGCWFLISCMFCGRYGIYHVYPLELTDFQLSFGIKYDLIFTWVAVAYRQKVIKTTIHNFFCLLRIQYWAKMKTWCNLLGPFGYFMDWTHVDLNYLDCAWFTIKWTELEYDWSWIIFNFVILEWWSINKIAHMDISFLYEA